MNCFERSNVTCCKMISATKLNSCFDTPTKKKKKMASEILRIFLNEIKLQSIHE